MEGGCWKKRFLPTCIEKDVCIVAFSELVGSLYVNVKI
jgi:hypothetical protein